MLTLCWLQRHLLLTPQTIWTKVPYTFGFRIIHPLSTVMEHGRKGASTQNIAFAWL